MGNFHVKKMKVKPNMGRGSVDATSVMEALRDNWEAVQEMLQNYSEEEQSAIKEHFNSFDEDNKTLGDALFGDYGGMEDAIGMLDDDTLEKFTDELINQGALDKDYLTTQ